MNGSSIFVPVLTPFKFSVVTDFAWVYVMTYHIFLVRVVGAFNDPVAPLFVSYCEVVTTGLGRIFVATVCWFPTAVPWFFFVISFKTSCVGGFDVPKWTEVSTSSSSTNGCDNGGCNGGDGSQLRAIAIFFFSPIFFSYIEELLNFKKELMNIEFLIFKRQEWNFTTNLHLFAHFNFISCTCYFIC